MKNKIYVEDKLVVKITNKKFKKCKSEVPVLVLNDNTEIRIRNNFITIICTKCGKQTVKRFKSWMIDKEYVCTSCKTSGINNPFYGKKHSEEFKQRLSKERIGMYVGEKNPMYGKPCYYNMTEERKQQWKDKIKKSVTGEKNPMYGKPCYYNMTEERKQQWKDKIKNCFKNKTEEEKKHISEKLRNSQLALYKKDPVAYSKLKAKGGKATASKKLKYVMTVPEKKVEQWLIDNKIIYEYSPIMGFKENCFQYDFIIHGKRTLIEVQGDYWHGNPIKYNIDGSNGKIKLNDIQKKKQLRDELKKQFALEKKFTLICIWESEINANDFSKLYNLKI